jgi:hypothetical protein
MARFAALVLEEAAIAVETAPRWPDPSESAAIIRALKPST